MLLNAVSAAIHTDTHFGATKNVLLEATYHPDMRDTKNWAEQHFFDFCILSVKIGPKSLYNGVEGFHELRPGFKFVAVLIMNKLLRTVV